MSPHCAGPQAGPGLILDLASLMQPLPQHPDRKAGPSSLTDRAGLDIAPWARKELVAVLGEEWMESWRVGLGRVCPP